MPSGAEHQMPDDGRSSERFATQASVSVRRSGSNAISGLVVDISASGFRIEALDRLPVGTTVWLKIGTLAPQMAKVMWNRDRLAGCQFSAPLHSAILSQILASAA